MKRVVITGCGTVNALAQNVEGTLAAFEAGKCAIAPLEIADQHRLAIKIGAQIKDWRPETHFARPQIALLDRFAQFALVAARQAVAQSGLNFDQALGDCSGVILGSAAGGMNTQDDTFRSVYQDGKDRVHPLVVPRLMHNAAASHLSIEFGLRGPSFCVSSACASSNHAMGLAYQAIRSGEASVMLTGGTEAMLTFGGLKAWEGLRVMSPDACRPFSLTRNGMVQGEGAAIFVFEDYDLARARGAEILAEVIGCAMTADAHDIVAPSTEGAGRTMLAALRSARIAPEAVGYVNAHGSATKANDTSEALALRRVFGDHIDRLPVSSTKSMHGHLIGGTGAVELLACLMALRSGIVAPTIGYEQPDPDCRIDAVPNTARRARVDVAMSNAFAFGGLNAVIVLRRAP